MYAEPNPSFPALCMAWTLWEAFAISSATLPVPSGELSSTTSTSVWSETESTSRTIFWMLSRSLYVGIITSALTFDLFPADADDVKPLFGVLGYYIEVVGRNFSRLRVERLRVPVYRLVCPFVQG